MQDYQKQLEESVNTYASRIARLEEHCLWLASMVENWSDEEADRHDKVLKGDTTKWEN